MYLQLFQPNLDTSGWVADFCPKTVLPGNRSSGSTVSHPLQLSPVSTRSLTSWILPMENGWPELACRMLE